MCIEGRGLLQLGIMCMLLDVQVDVLVDPSKQTLQLQNPAGASMLCTGILHPVCVAYQSCTFLHLIGRTYIVPRDLW